MVKSSETERKERMDTSSLMEQILSSDNLNRAYLQVVRNKGAEGVDRMKYTELKEYLAKNGERIKEQLRTRKYKPQPVRRVEIPKPDGGVRNLGVPTVTDRFIQQAIAQVLTPIYEEQFHDHSYGFRPNRCAQQAILTALDMMNDGNDWIVDIDLEKFFDTVNHDKLMTIIGRTIKDGDVISIVRKYLVSGIMIDDEYEDSIVGTPQGGNLSPLLANIMLNELDKEMEKRGLKFVYELGLNPKLIHKPDLKDRGELKLFYGLFKLTNGGYGFEVMSKADMDQYAKEYSKSFDSAYSPWTTHYESMAKKTIIKQALKYAPLQTDVRRILTTDETIKNDISMDMSEISDETIWETEYKEVA